MLPQSDQLEVKISTLPNSGMGLFAKIEFQKGERIIEYCGEMLTWQQVEDDADNGYIFHIDDEHVIDARNCLEAFGRYANDAAGLSRVKGVRNNALYEEEDYSVFIVADKKIKAGEEIFVAYGKEYWQQVKENIKIDQTKK
ncbi:MAG: SET domain-containing protein [Chitinophagaceae bacterium]|nr:MAG: SET domain-containing protein [Chitinophagaceae bacterium]